MFVTKAYHRHQLELATSRAAFQETVIQMLQNQVEDLKRLIFVQPQTPTPETLQVDAVLSGSEKPVDTSEQDQTALIYGQRELDSILSGTYDEGLPN